MTVSRNSGLIAGLVAAILLWSLPVMAQSTGPKLLRPGAQTTPAQQPKAPEGIQVNRLDAPGRVAAGVLREEDGGLPADLWSGSDRGTISALLDRMPAYYTSSTAREVARTLLLSEGAMPPGQPDDNHLLGQRMDLVLTLGDAESAVSLSQAAGGGAQTPAVAQPLAESLFALGETDRACDTVQGQIRLGGRGYWQQASVYCDIRADRIDAAELTLSLLSETGQGGETFLKLTDALLGDTALDIEANAGMRALDGAMIASAKSAVIRDAGSLPPHVAVRLSSESALVIDGRIASGISAVRAAGMSPALIMLMFGDSAGDPGAPFRNPVVTAMSATTAIVRAEALNELWNKASGPENQATAAAFAEGFLKKLQPEAGLSFLAPAALRMNLLNGDLARAEGWLVALRRNATAGNGSPDDLARAQALARLAGIGGVDDRGLAVWLEAALVAEDKRPAMTILLALDALGDPAGAAVWRRILAESGGVSGGVTRDLAIWRQLVMSAGGDRMGESIAAALVLIGSGPVSGIDPVSLATVAGTLRRMGLEAQARRLVIEAVIGLGG